MPTEILLFLLLLLTPASVGPQERIVAVAIGSSFVHGWAGCWQPSLETLFDLGIIPNP